MLAVVAALSLPLGACGGASTADAADDPTVVIADDNDQGGAGGEATATTQPVAPTEISGMTFENPMKLCGPMQSYEAVSRLACRDGSQPLQGDAHAGQAARRGSGGPHTEPDPADVMNSHIVDIYEVPCPEGPLTVYVCMYHCPDGQSPLGR